MLVVLHAIAVLAAAQQPTGALTGRVYEDGDGYMPFVKVIAEGPTIDSAISHDAGEYRFSSLAPGYYSLRVSWPGYEPVRRDSVLVRVGRVDTVSLGMRLTPGMRQFRKEQDSLCATGPPPLTRKKVQQLGRAPTTIVLGNRRLVLEATAWLNLDGGRDQECRMAPLRIILHLRDKAEADSTPLQPDSAWVLDPSRGLGFEAPLSPLHVDSLEAAAGLARRIWGGAWWVENRDITVVLQVRDSRGTTRLLRISGVKAGSVR
jgi:hypothetical protein